MSDSSVPGGVHEGQAVYGRWVLRGYDLWVLGVSNYAIWRCPTWRITAWYDRHVSGRHADVGVGTGYFLDHTSWPRPEPRITLIDLNEQSLAAAAARVRRYRPARCVANVLEPIPEPLGVPFGSIGLNYLLHCLPGTLADKAGRVFANLTEHAEPGARVFGATILPFDLPASPAARALAGLYNRKGIFHNRDDRLADLETALEHTFTDVELKTNGCVALFAGRTPS